MALAKSGGDEAVRRELLGAMSLVDAMEDPALIADTRGRIAHLNAAAVRTLNVAEPSELVRVPLSHILELPADSSGGAQPGLRVNRRGASAVVASMEKLLRSDGREYGSLVVFGSMKKRESRLLETSANEANSTLISYLPGPGAAGPGYRVGGFLEPCLSGSGDFFDVFPADDDTTAFYSLDVMGHGIIASLMAFSLHELLPLLGRSSAGRTPSPSDVLRNLYGRYCQRGASRTLFFTISYGVIKNATGEYRAARGGHIPLIHLALDGEVRVHTTKGSAVGIQEDVEVEESRGVLEPGGRLILVSDGVAESFGGDRSMDSALARIRDFSASFRNVDLGIFVDSLRRQVRREAVGRMTEDDKSMLVIERQRRP